MIRCLHATGTDHRLNSPTCETHAMSRALHTSKYVKIRLDKTLLILLCVFLTWTVSMADTDSDIVYVDCREHEKRGELTSNHVQQDSRLRRSAHSRQLQHELAEAARSGKSQEQMMDIYFSRKRLFQLKDELKQLKERHKTIKVEMENLRKEIKTHRKTRRLHRRKLKSHRKNPRLKQDEMIKPQSVQNCNSSSNCTFEYIRLRTYGIPEYVDSGRCTNCLCENYLHVCHEVKYDVPIYVAELDECIKSGRNFSNMTTVRWLKPYKRKYVTVTTGCKCVPNNQAKSRQSP